MICQYCGAELDENLDVCPKCQRNIKDEKQELKETTESAELKISGAKKSKTKFPLLEVILCAIAACATVALIIFGPKIVSKIKESHKTKEEPQQTESSVETDADSDSDNGELTEIDSYTVQDIDASDPRMKEIVATCGDSRLTNSELQILFRSEYENFMQYAPYYAMYGMEAPDETLPLSEQIRTEDSLTWEQYFLKSALDFGHELLAAQEEGKKNGFELDAETQQIIDSLPETLSQEATANGFDSVLAYTQDTYGKGVTDEDFINFYKFYLYASAYENEMYNNLPCTDEQVNEFYENNPDVMTSNGVSKESANVRHLLCKPADEDGDGTSTEEEWAAAEARAQELYEKYLKDPTEDHFAELASEYTDDPGSKENGGLYENVIPGQTVQEFNDWIFDEARKEYDSEIVKTDYGYHIMLFLSCSENDTWFEQCKDLYKQDLMPAEIEKMLANNPQQVSYNKIVLEEIKMAEEPATESAAGTAG